MPFFLCPFGHSTEKPVTKEEIDQDIPGMVAKLDLESL